MTESSTAAATSAWTAPQCPFKIEYSLRALDDIRLAVMDAFFSLPRGGAEIGGILLGSWSKGRLVINDYVALDCEHAFGPSFALSRNDETRLGQLLAADYPGQQIVGWYHSHTRTDIFLSQADLEIYRRFFPEPYQVALVIKPHTFQPARIGFFFRDAEGNIHSEAAYKEDTLAPLPMKAVSGGGMASDLPSNGAAEPKGAPVEPPPVSRSMGARENPLMEAAAALAASRQPQVIDAVAEPSAETAQPRDVHDTYSIEAEVPSFGMNQPEPRSGIWPWAFALAMVVGLTWAGYATREAWWPKVQGLVGHEAAALPPAIGLNLIDREGQLQIHWNTQSPAIARAVGGVLRITGTGPFPSEITLDKAHLLNGYFTFQRQSERVDVALIIPQPSGPPAAEITSFAGKMPDKKPIFVEDPEAKKEREKLATQVTEMQTELKSQVQENRNLKHSMEQLQNQLRLQTQKRLANQDKQND